MKRTIEELQFASTVRSMVEARRRSRLPEDATPEQIAASKAEPIDDLVADVLDELDRLAGVINRALSAASPEPPRPPRSAQEAGG